MAIDVSESLSRPHCVSCPQALTRESLIRNRSLQTVAYNCWKTRLDAALTTAPTAYGTQLLRNTIPLYAIAHCTLAVDVDELQIFAGATKAFSLPVVGPVAATSEQGDGSRG